MPRPSPPPQCWHTAASHALHAWYHFPPASSTYPGSIRDPCASQRMRPQRAMHTRTAGASQFSYMQIGLAFGGMAAARGGAE